MRSQAIRQQFARLQVRWERQIGGPNYRSFSRRLNCDLFRRHFDSCFVRDFWNVQTFVSLHTSKPLECVIGRILNASVAFVEQANCLECFMAQSKAVFRLERVKYQI
jgi:hypothetical protein